MEDTELTGTINGVDDADEVVVLVAVESEQIEVDDSEQGAELVVVALVLGVGAGVESRHSGKKRKQNEQWTNGTDSEGSERGAIWLRIAIARDCVGMCVHDGSGLHWTGSGSHNTRSEITSH